MNPHKGYNKCAVEQESSDKSIDGQRLQARKRAEKVSTCRFSHPVHLGALLGQFALTHGLAPC